MRNKLKNIFLTATVILLTACGGGSGGSIPSAGSGSNYGNNDSIKEITPIISKLDLDGNTYAIELSNDKKTAYFANGVKGVAIVDVADIKKPKLISKLQLGEQSARSGDNIVDIKLSKDNKTAYLVGSDDGLYIVDISNINNPTLIGKFKTDGRARRVRLSQNEDIAYVAIGDYDESKSGLSIIDISNHSNPTRIGKYHAENSVRGIAITKDDKKAFLVDDYKGLKIVDISNKNNPKLIRKVEFSHTELDSIELSKNEKSLYIMGGSYLIVVDISTIDNPKVIKRVLTPSHTHNITVTKNMLYLAPDVGIQFVNIDDPKKAFREGSFSTPFYTQDISVSDDEKVAYLANGLDGLVIMDISKHKSPALISGGLRENSVLGFDLALSNDEKVSYQAQGGEGIRIVDVSNPKNPKVIALFEPEQEFNFYAEYIALSNDNHYAYVVDSGNHKLHIVDITNPSSPVLVGSYNYKYSKFLNYSNACTGIAISKDNKKAYLSIWEHGFIVVDIQDPNNPHEIAGLELRGEHSEAHIEGITINKDDKNLFLPTSNGVLIFDISDLGNISMVSRTFHHNPVNVILSDDEKKMFVLDEDTMYIEDISDIQHPKRLSYLRDVGDKLVISKDNKRAYSTNRYNGLRVIDITNPTKPKIVGKIVLPGLAINLSVTNNEDIAYIETFQSGLAIMSLKDFK